MNLIQQYRILSTDRSGEKGYLVSEYRDAEGRLYYRECHVAVPMFNRNDPYYEVYRDVKRLMEIKSGVAIAQLMTN